MARNAGSDQQTISEDGQVQAAFDFMPQEMRHRLRFGDVLRAGRADLRNQSWMIDRQVVGIGSRIAAARLREILRPASDYGAAAYEATAYEAAAYEASEAGMDSSHQMAREASQDLAQQREILREIGTAVFYFRDEEETPADIAVQSQRLHPRPLPARYYGAPPQQAGAGSQPDPCLSQRKIA